MTNPFPDYLNLNQAATRLAIHPTSLRRLIKQGVVPAQVIHGSWLIRRDALEMFAANYDPKPGRKPVPTLFGRSRR